MQIWSFIALAHRRAPCYYASVEAIIPVDTGDVSPGSHMNGQFPPWEQFLLWRVQLLRIGCNILAKDHVVLYRHGSSPGWCLAQPLQERQC